MLKKLITSFLMIGLLVMSARAAIEDNKFTKLPLGTVRINQVVFQVEIADNDAARIQGLSGRAALGKNKGMYFEFPFAKSLSFWMKDMRFPLDIVWIKDQMVIGITRDIPPPAPGTASQNLKHYPSPQPADSVLELEAGGAEGIQVGDKAVLLRGPQNHF